MIGTRRLLRIRHDVDSALEAIGEGTLHWQREVGRIEAVARDVSLSLLRDGESRRAAQVSRIATGLNRAAKFPRQRAAQALHGLAERVERMLRAPAREVTRGLTRTRARPRGR